jgi:hypothetical protein
MVGTPAQPGMIPLSLSLLFERCGQLLSQGWRFSLSSAMLEIYNESIRDLLVKDDGKEHKITLDGSVTNLTVAEVTSPEQAQGLVHRAMTQRTVRDDISCTLGEQKREKRMG